MPVQQAKRRNPAVGRLPHRVASLPQRPVVFRHRLPTTSRVQHRKLHKLVAHPPELSPIPYRQQHRAYDPTKTVPTLILRNDDFGRVERLLADGEDVKMEFHIVNHVFPEGKTSYNVVAEIPGTDKADEIVMLGGHLDSWHAATGATDNAIGSAIMMEAGRLIQSMGLKPRGGVRVALWSGEEEGLLGSLAYVKQHFGTAENPRPEWAKLDCYFNVDTGTGRLRGAGIFGPPEAAAVLRPVLAQFTDWGVFGASTTNSRATGGTDSTSFNNAGLPGVGFSQDPIEYNTLTHHTNQIGRASCRERL